MLLLRPNRKKCGSSFNLDGVLHRINSDPSKFLEFRNQLIKRGPYVRSSVLEVLVDPNSGAGVCLIVVLESFVTRWASPGHLFLQMLLRPNRVCLTHPLLNIRIKILCGVDTKEMTLEVGCVLRVTE